ncbi:MAG: hypothetical protein ACP5I6_05790 [Caldisphaera sp.]
MSERNPLPPIKINNNSKEVIIVYVMNNKFSMKIGEEMRVILGFQHLLRLLYQVWHHVKQ